MDPCVAGQLRVEGRDEDPPLTGEDGMPVDRREDLHIRSCLADPRCPDEDRAKRLVLAGDLDVGLEARDLPTERIPLHGDVDQAEPLAIEDDHPGARPEHCALEALDRVIEPVEPGQPHDRRRFAARDDEPVEPVELMGQTHLDHIRPESPEHVHVLAEGALERQHPDLRPQMHAKESRGGTVGDRSLVRGRRAATDWGS